MKLRIKAIFNCCGELYSGELTTDSGEQALHWMRNPLLLLEEEDLDELLNDMGEDLDEDFQGRDEKSKNDAAWCYLSKIRVRTQDGGHVHFRCERASDLVTPEQVETLRSWGIPLPEGARTVVG